MYKTDTLIQTAASDGSNHILKRVSYGRVVVIRGYIRYRPTMNKYYDDEEEEEPVAFKKPVETRHQYIPKPKNDEELFVKDEQGRRRFHGAFTGGFSAGYYNTVGSAEGWVPSQFTSSREQGQWSRELVKNKPEDYMDEEDQNVLRFSSNRVPVTEEEDGASSFAGFRTVSDIKPKAENDKLEQSSKPLGPALAGTLNGKKILIEGDAFGYGALSDEEDLDEDAVVYSKDDMSQYDFQLGGSKKRKKKVPIFGLPPPPTEAEKKKKRSRWDIAADNDHCSIEGQPGPSGLSQIKVEKEDIESPSTSRIIGPAKPLFLKTGNEVDEVAREVIVPTKPRLAKPLCDLSKTTDYGFAAAKFFSKKFAPSSSSTTENEQKLEPGLTRTSALIASSKKGQDDVVKTEDETRSEVGTVRRTSYQWFPAKLLSKRFNIPPPYPQFPDIIGIVASSRSHKKK